MRNEELIEINNTTGEIILPCENEEDAKTLKLTKI